MIIATGARPKANLSVILSEAILSEIPPRTLSLINNLKNKTIANKLIYIPYDDSQNYPFYGWQLVVESFAHLT